jgi:hypothetical protein
MLAVAVVNIDQGGEKANANEIMKHQPATQTGLGFFARRDLSRLMACHKEIR